MRKKLSDAEKIYYGRQAAVIGDAKVAKITGYAERTVADWRRESEASSNAKIDTGNANVSTESLTSQVAVPVGAIESEVEWTLPNDERDALVEAIEIGDNAIDNLRGTAMLLMEFLPLLEEESYGSKSLRAAEKLAAGLDQVAVLYDNNKENWLHTITGIEKEYEYHIRLQNPYDPGDSRIVAQMFCGSKHLLVPDFAADFIHVSVTTETAGYEDGDITDFGFNQDDQDTFTLTGKWDLGNLPVLSRGDIEYSQLDNLHLAAIPVFHKSLNTRRVSIIGHLVEVEK